MPGIIIIFIITMKIIIMTTLLFVVVLRDHLVVVIIVIVDVLSVVTSRAPGHYKIVSDLSVEYQPTTWNASRCLLTLTVTP